MSQINVKELKCPVCGAPINLKDNGYGQTQCNYCRAIVYIDREDTGNNGDKTIYSQDNKPLATLSIPLGWDVKNTFVNYAKATLGIPYGICIDLENNMGSIIHIETGNSFSEFGAAIGQHQDNHTMQKEFETVDKYLDEYIAELAKSNKVTMNFKEEIDIPLEKYDKQEDFNEYKAKTEDYVQRTSATIGGKFNITGLYCDSACRVYETNDKIIVAYTKEYGNLASMAGVGMLNNGINNLMQNFSGFFNQAKENVNNKNVAMNSNSNNSSILNKMADSGLLGGMLGRKYRTNQQNNNVNVQEESKVEEKEQQQAQEVNPMLFGQLRKPGIGEALEWQSDPIFVLITSKDEYKNLVEKAFKQVCSSFKLSREVETEYSGLKNQWEQENRNATNAQAAMQRQNGERLIEIGRQRSAANQKYIDSMMERSNKQYQSQRDSYNSRVAAQDRMRDQRSEAIRGVNTYIRPDGKEVEVPVSADTAWINGKGEIVGGSAGFNPGTGWTKMERKQ